ncbi:MAG: NAD(P)/FAD-dependent oxidoreductase [Actinocatenispora sp.]
MRPDRPVVIAGAGIGGLTAALALHQRGLPVEVYERRTPEQIRTAPGSGLTLWSNASTSLGWLGLGEPLLAAGERVVAIHSYDAKYRVRFRMDSHKYLWPDALPSLSIGRMDLAEVLMTACQERGVPVHYGHTVAGYRDGEDGVEVKVDGVGDVAGSALIGADGVRSAVLTQLHGSVPGIYLGRTTYRGVVPGSEGVVPEIPQLFHDPASGIGGGVYPVGGDRVAWTLSTHAPAGERDTPEQTLKHARELATVLPEVLRTRVDRTPAEAILRTDIWYHEWHENWGTGHVTLLGDAAHAMPNDLGQGACQAVEDGLVLADALAAADSTDGGLRAYEQRRYERVKWVREQSVRVATAPEPENPVVRFVMGKLTRMYLSMAEKQMWTEMQRLPELSDRPAREPGRAA